MTQSESVTITIQRHGSLEEYTLVTDEAFDLKVFRSAKDGVRVLLDAKVSDHRIEASPRAVQR